MIVRLRKTYADYLAIALCPVLIMLAVGSLVFFLLMIGYSGSHVGELRWTLFWFVLAMVLVSRIAIEKGYDHAGVYGFALAAATGYMLLQYAAVNIGVWLLLALIWWATNKLTWDCTVIDDDADASGEGLLQAAKLDGEKKGTEAAAAPGEPAGKKPKSPTWQRLLGKRASTTTQPHAPGKWVIYFSLGALLIFGLGQGLIPAQDTAARQYGFCLLGIYLAAALGLLLITSFLGLRRYLRQRQLEMPSVMSITWVTMGAVLALSILGACVLLPRPQATWSLTAMIDRLGDPPHHSSTSQATSPKNFEDAKAEGAGEQRDKDGKATSEQPKDDGRGQAATPDTESQGEKKKDQNRTADGKGGEKQASKEDAPVRGTAGQANKGEPEGASGEKDQKPQPNKNSSGAPGNVTPVPKPRPTFAFSPQAPAGLLKSAVYVALALLGLYLVIKNKAGLLAGLQELWRSLLEFWAGLFARGEKEKQAGAQEAPAPVGPSHPFATFANPFASGRAAQMPLAELIVYTFTGLEAWAAEHQCGRRPDQTPLEFAGQLSELAPDLAFEAKELTRLYIQVAYAEGSTLPSCMTLLESLWGRMTLG